MRCPGLLALRLELRPPRGLRLARLGLERLLGLLDLRQPALTTLKLYGQLIAATIRPEALIFLRVNLLGLSQQRVDVRSQLGDLGLQLPP